MNNTVLLVCVVAVAMHWIFVPAFVRSVFRRELRNDDRDAYRAVEEETLPTAQTKRPIPESTLPVTRTRMVVLFGFLITMFVLILASLVYITVAAPPIPSGAD